MYSAKKNFLKPSKKIDKKVFSCLNLWKVIFLTFFLEGFKKNFSQKNIKNQFLIDSDKKKFHISLIVEKKNLTPKVLQLWAVLKTQIPDWKSKIRHIQSFYFFMLVKMRYLPFS